jgi:hypothetical protein
MEKKGVYTGIMQEKGSIYWNNAGKGGYILE